ncbi:DUF1840 domain-containing protein [Alginatibacterium sediminis]|nr:DUF1840 domain-containing protein [Alginatibacterium sediminis]
MLVIFKSNNHGDITMFGDVAKQLILAMDCSGNIPAGLHADDIHDALKSLLSVVNAPATDSEQDDEDAVENENWQPSLKQRAIPLIEMLEGALHHQDGITWENA